MYYSKKRPDTDGNCIPTCVSAEFDALLKPITSLPPGSIRLNVTAQKHHTKE